MPKEVTLTENIKKNDLGKFIEEQQLHWPPDASGTRREYHGLTRGWILNEIFRRVHPEGKTLGEFFKEELNGKLGADVFLGHQEGRKQQVFFADRKNIWFLIFFFFSGAAPAIRSRCNVGLPLAQFYTYLVEWS